MIGNNYMVILVERKIGKFYRRFLIRSPRTNSIRAFESVTSAANFVEYLEGLDAFDSNDRLVIINENEVPELGIHFSKCVSV